MKLNKLSVVICVLSTVIAGCSTGPNQADASMLETGVNLRTDYLGGTDVEGFHFDITRVACDGEEIEDWSTSFNVDLADSVFPHGVELLEQTYDSASQHVGSDVFVSLEVGCYSVDATPASRVDGDDWVASEDCAESATEVAEVTDGATSEVVLLSQCVGDEFLGNLSAVATLNHPPVLEIALDTAFALQCEEITFCALSWDDDNDPIEFGWELLSDATVYSGEISELEAVGIEDGHVIWEQCATMVGADIAEFEFLVTAYDLDADGGRLEAAVEGESHDTQQFAVQTSFGETPMCWDEDAGEAVIAEGYAEVARAEGCDYLTPEEMFCSGEYEVDSLVAAELCDGAALREDVYYPSCD